MDALNNMDDDLLTPMDQFMNLVKSKKKIEDASASKILKVDADTLSMWASALEEEGVITINYSLGKTYYAWVGGENGGISEEEPIHNNDEDDNPGVHEQNNTEDASVKINQEEEKKVINPFDVASGEVKANPKTNKTNEVPEQTSVVSTEDSVATNAGDKSKINLAAVHSNSLLNEQQPVQNPQKSTNPISKLDSRLEQDAKKLGELSENFNGLYQKILPVLNITLSKMQSVGRIKDDIADSKKEVVGIGQSLDKLKGDKDKILESLNAVGPKLQGGIQTYFDLSASAKEITRQLKSLEGRMNDFSTQIKKVSTGPGIKPMQLRDMLRKYSHLTSGLRDLQMKYDDMFSSLEQFKNMDENIHKIEETLEGYNESIGAAKSDTQVILSEVKDVQEKATSLRKEMEKYSKMLTSLKSFVKKSKDVLGHMGDFKNILKQKNVFGKKLDDITAEISKLDSGVSSLKKLGSVSTNFASIRDDFSRLRNVSREMIANITKTVKTNDQYYTNLEKVLNGLKPKLTAYKTEMEGISKNVDLLVESNKKKLMGIKQDLGSIDDLSNSTEILEGFQKLRKLSDLTENVESLRVELISLSKAILKLKKVKTIGLAKGESDEIGVYLKKPNVPLDGLGMSQSSLAPTTLSKEEEMLFRKKQEDLRNLMDQMMKPAASGDKKKGKK